MNYRVVWLSGIVLGAAGAAGACNAPDPGEVTFSERSKTESSASGSGGGSSGTGSSSGTPAGDGGGGDSGPAGDPVFGTTTYKGTSPGQNANQQGGTDHAGNVEGKNCLQAGACHGGPTNPYKWGFAGTVYSTMNGGATVKNAEVAVTDPTGKMTLVTADDNGNYWYEGAKPAAGSRSGVRTATKSMNMVSTLDATTGAGCQADACHGLGTQKLYVQ